MCILYLSFLKKKIDKIRGSVANVLILENPGVSTSKKDCGPPEQLSLTQKEACVTDNLKNSFAYIKTSQTEKTNSGFNYKPLNKEL